MFSSMFPSSRRVSYLPLAFGGPGLVRRSSRRSRSASHTLRVAYLEAEILVTNNLRCGRHPDALGQFIQSELLRTPSGSIDYHVLNFARRLLDNIRRAGQFQGLPSFTEFQQINAVRPDLARFENMMRDRFMERGFVCRYGMDDDIAREIAICRALDREAEEELRFMRKQGRREVEEQYRANEEILRVGLAGANLRAEPAWAQFNNRDRLDNMGNLPFMARGQAPFQQYGGIVEGMRGPNDYYGFQANDPDRYGRYEEDAMRYDDPDRIRIPRDQYQDYDGRNDAGAYGGSFRSTYDVRNEGPLQGREYYDHYSSDYKDPRDPGFSPGFRYV